MKDRTHVRATGPARSWRREDGQVRSLGMGWGWAVRAMRREESLYIPGGKRDMKSGTMGYYSTLIGACFGIWQRHLLFPGVEVMCASFCEPSLSWECRGVRKEGVKTGKYNLFIRKQLVLKCLILVKRICGPSTLMPNDEPGVWFPSR